MLKIAGIKAYISLITTYRLIDKEIATPLNFNHAITAILNEDGTYKFLDPTNEVLRYGFLPSADQYRYALVAKENGGDLVLTPTEGDNKNKYETIVEMNIKDLTKAEISEKEILTGGYEYRRVDARKYPEERLKNDLKENLSKKYKNVEIESLKYENLNGEGELICNTKLKLEDTRKLAGELNSLNPLESGKIIEDGNVIAKETRSTEIEFNSPWKLSANVIITIPDTLTVEYLPKTVEFRNDKFGEYNYTVENNGSIIKINRTFILNKKRVSINDYNEFKEFYQKCIDYDNQNILVKKK
jgi:cellulose synthase operon protein C